MSPAISPDIRVKDLQEPDLAKLREYIEANYKIEGDLRREIAGDIRRKVEIQSYQEITAPLGSVIETMVLLKVLLMYLLRDQAQAGKLQFVHYKPLGWRLEPSQM